MIRLFKCSEVYSSNKAVLSALTSGVVLLYNRLGEEEATFRNDMRTLQDGGSPKVNKDGLLKQTEILKSGL